MILADYTIRRALIDGVLTIEPEPQDWQIQPASVELTLGNQFMTPYNDTVVTADKYYMISAGECLLATTAERVKLGDSLVGRIEGKSSWGRRFLLTHVTAGFVDPGFDGQLTLELVNLSNVSQVLHVGEPIAQMSFQWTDVTVHRPYGSPELGSHYQHQSGVTPSALPWR